MFVCMRMFVFGCYLCVSVCVFMFVCAFVCDSMLDASWLCVCASCAFMTVSVVKNLMWGEPSVL